MKRYILIIGAILLGLAARAQSVTYTCRYWFDMNHAQTVTTTFGESGWEAELDVGSLAFGLHSLHLHVMDTSMKWSAPQSYLFLKIDSAGQGGTNYVYHYWFDQDYAHKQSGTLGNGHLLLDVDELSSGLHSLHLMLKGSTYSTAQSYLFLKTDPASQGGDSFVYHCWFDQDYEHQQSDNLGTGHLLLDVADLEEGMHTVHVMLEGTQLTTAESYLFMKAAQFATDTIDMSHLAYHCWFDQDFEHQQIDSLGNGHLLLDVNDLEDGLHTVHVMLQGSTLTATQSYMFMKMAVEDPSTEMQYICWFDQDYGSAQTGPLGDGLFELEVSELPNGIHTVNVQLSNGTRTAPQCYLFYKQPLGGYGIARWEYWLNDNIANRQITNISPTVDTLDIISLLNVGHPALRSSCFHFHPNGDAPYINAKNEISFRFWDSEMRFIDKSAYYVDEQVQQDIVATVFERNTTETFAAPRNNQIQWFKVEAGVGDSLAFVADKACTMQLFAPSGEEVYNASGPESVVLGGLHAREDGIYYLAVHEVMGSGETVSVTYQYLHKYAVLAYDVHLVGNGGCSTITFQGNGFNSLLDVYLVNAQNDTIQRLDIGHESNTTTTVTFNFYQVNLGVYDAVFQFYDEIIRINGALEVQEPVDIVLTSSVSYPSLFLRNTACTYTYTITNNGNMTAYGVPIYIYISTPTEDGISYVSVDGLPIESFYESICSITDWNADELHILKEYGKLIGDDNHFIKHKGTDEITGDSVFIRTGFFAIDIPSYSSITVNLSLTASERIETWITLPNIWFSYNLENNQSRYGFKSNEFIKESFFCCYHELFEDMMNITSWGSAAIALIAAAVAVVVPATAPISGPTAIYSGLVSCITGALSYASSQFAKIYCTHEGLPPKFNWPSPIATIVSCATGLGGKAAGIAAAQAAAGFGVTSFGLGLSDQNPNKSYDCQDEDPLGGESTPVDSFDPNDIFGYTAESGSHYMRQEIQNIHYEIEFENDTTLATAAAHTIIVRDTLDATKFDLNSLATYSVTLGDKRLDLNGELNFARTLDMRPELYVIAQINQDYDPATSIVAWTIQSLDPMTMEPTTDPNQGVLPINYYGDGIGFIDYSINLLQAFDDGTEVSNRAGIIFDQNDVIMTPTWTNIVDAVKPVSYIEEVTFEDDTLNFSFISSDNRSGVWYHTLYYRNDSTYQEWQVRKAQIFENNFMLHLEDLQTTEYLVMAVDSAGNHEDKLFNAEYVFGLDSLEYYTLTLESQGCGEVNGAGTYLAGSHVTIEAIPDEGCQFEQWNDGNTDNPRTIELVQDTTFVAQFTFDSMGTTQTIAFSEGYNWWSTYIEQNGIDGLSMLQEGLSNNGITIRSQASGYTDYYGEDYGWWGSLTSINNESSYRVVVSTPCTVTMTGTEAVPSQHPITLNHGWTWMGYVPSTAMDVNTAMAGMEASDGDMLKSQQGYADYYPNYGWYGSLNTIEPGMGLMYYSANSETVTFTYPYSNREGELKKNLTAEHNHWKPNTFAYPDNMTVMAVVELNEMELKSDNYELAAFTANGECRGSVKLTYAEPINRHVAFLTISGKDAAELSFRLYDTETGMEYYDAEESLSFVANAIVGRADDLYTIHFRGMTGMDELANRVKVYPNPVNHGEQFSIGLADTEASLIRLEIVDALGAIVSAVTSTKLPASLVAPETTGVYTVKILVDNKAVYCRKLVVR